MFREDSTEEEGGLGLLKEESRLGRQKEGQNHLARCKRGATSEDRTKAQGQNRGQEQPGLEWGDEACGEICLRDQTGVWACL